LSPLQRHLALQLIGHYGLNRERGVAQLLLSLEDPDTGEKPDLDEIARRRDSQISQSGLKASSAAHVGSVLGIALGRAVE
jgi:hypothetical protein